MRSSILLEVFEQRQKQIANRKRLIIAMALLWAEIDRLDSNSNA